MPLAERIPEAEYPAQMHGYRARVVVAAFAQARGEALHARGAVLVLPLLRIVKSAHRPLEAHRADRLRRDVVHPRSVVAVLAAQRAHDRGGEVPLGD